MRILCNRDDNKEPISLAAGIDIQLKNLKPNDQLVFDYDYFIGPREYYTFKKI